MNDDRNVYQDKYEAMRAFLIAYSFLDVAILEIQVKIIYCPISAVYNREIFLFFPHWSHVATYDHWSPRKSNFMWERKRTQLVIFNVYVLNML